MNKTRLDVGAKFEGGGGGGGITGGGWDVEAKQAPEGEEPWFPTKKKNKKRQKGGVPKGEFLGHNVSPPGWVGGSKQREPGEVTEKQPNAKIT